MVSIPLLGGIDSNKAISTLQPIQNSRFPDPFEITGYTQLQPPWSTIKETQ